jgi:hypothetical protein
MTISNTSPSISYIGNDVTTNFSVPFQFIDDADLRVRTYPDPNDRLVWTDHVLGVDYTVTGGDGAVGAVDMNVAPATAAELEIVSFMPYGQTISYSKHGTFPAETHERALDRLAIQMKQVAEGVGGSGGVGGLAGVAAFNGREGIVTSQESDYSSFYSLTSHTHTWSQITGKPTLFPPEYHTHPWGEITGKPTTFDPTPHTHQWGEVTNKPATYPAGGTASNAIQVRNVDGTATQGEDLLRGTSVQVNTDLTSGVFEIYANDSFGGTTPRVGRVGGGISDGVFVSGYFAQDGYAGGLKGDSLHLFANNLIEGEALYLGANGLLTSRESATPPTTDVGAYSATDLTVLDGSFVSIPVDTVVSSDTVPGSGSWSGLIPFTASNNQNFDLTIELVVDGTPTGRTFVHSHTAGAGSFEVSISGGFGVTVNSGQIASYRATRAGGTLDVTIPCTVTPATLNILHFGSGGQVSLLNDLLDVDADAPADATVLTWNDGLGLWQALPAGGSSGVSSFAGRSGVVNPIQADYASFYRDITYVSDWAEITNKPTDFPPSAHTHPISEVTNLQTTLDGKAPTVHTHDYATEITGKPSTFPPDSHSHPQSEVTNLVSDLGNKADDAITITGTGGLTGGGDLTANRQLSIEATSNGYGTRTVSTSAPTGGADGDIWYVVDP